MLAVIYRLGNWDGCGRLDRIGRANLETVDVPGPIWSNRHKVGLKPRLAWDLGTRPEDETKYARSAYR